MRCLCVLVSLVVVLAAGSQASAMRCHDFDSVYSPAILCDDFDRYCQGAPADGSACPTGATRSDGQLRAMWHAHGWNYNTASACGNDFVIQEDQSVLTTAPFGGRHPNEGSTGGYLEQSVVDLTTYVQDALPGLNATNGDDDHPLLLRFSVGGGINLANKLPFSNGYLELALGDGDPLNPNGRYNANNNPNPGDSPETHAPTDYVMLGSDVGPHAGCFECYNSCPSPDYSVSVPWPTICQQEFPNAACPSLSTTVRPVLAIGVLAELDNNPCHCENPAQQVPNNNHLSFFDGLRWRILKSGMFPGAGSTGDFVWGHRANTIEFIVKTSTIDVHHIGYEYVPGGADITRESWGYGMPRQYLGVFNRLRLGTGTSCELKGPGNAYECKQSFVWGGGKCQRMGAKGWSASGCGTGAWQTNKSGYVAFDTIYLGGGIGGSFTPRGACCAPGTPTRTCVENATVQDCTTLGGQWTAQNVPCSSTTCCPAPFGDTDQDGDMDMDDFAVFQRCLSTAGGVPSGCRCFDRVAPAGVIDSLDLQEFIDCATGAAVDGTVAGCDGHPIY
jgi:hypothetical protein